MCFCLNPSMFVLKLTVARDIRSPEFNGSDDLFPQLPLVVHKHTGQILLRKVGDAGLRNSFQELCVRKLLTQLGHVLVEEGTQRDSAKIL